MDKPGVIMQIAGSLGIGGAERVAMALAQYGPQQGLKSVYVAATNHRNRAAFRQQLREKGVLVFELGGSLRTKWRVMRSIAALTRPDLIHAHTELPELLSLAAKMAVPEAQLVRTLHNSVHWPGHKLLGQAVDFLYQWWDGHQFACSSEVAKVGDEVILNGIPWSWSQPRKKRGAVVFVGRMEPQKNPGAVIQIVDHARKQGYSLELAMIGDGQLKDALMARYQDSWIHWLGAVDDPRPYLAQAQVVLFASHFEGFPLVVLEALTTLTWVLAPDMAGFRHLPWVFCYPRNDLTQAALGLVSLLNQDPGPLYVWRQVYRDQYADEVMLSRYFHAYGQLLATRGSHTSQGGRLSHEQNAVSFRPRK